MRTININDFLRAQQHGRRMIKNITSEVNVSPPVGTPEFDEWKKKLEKAKTKDIAKI